MYLEDNKLPGISTCDPWKPKKGSKAGQNILLLANKAKNPTCVVKMKTKKLHH